MARFVHLAPEKAVSAIRRAGIKAQRLGGSPGDGFEVLIPRRIEPKEIRRVASLPQVTGWRYHPGAKGTKPCGCPFCTKGDIKSKRIRDAYDEQYGAAHRVVPK